MTHTPVQVTGKQLKNGLLPPSHLLPGYVTLLSSNSGGSLEHVTSRSIPPMDCFIYLASIGVDKGYGETAFADQMAAAKSTPPFTTQEIFQQAVYQFAGSRAASSFFSQISAKSRTCKVVIRKDTKGGTLKQVVHSRSALRVGGHQSLPVEYLTDSKTPDPRRPPAPGQRQVGHEDQRGELDPGGQPGPGALPPGPVLAPQQVGADQRGQDQVDLAQVERVRHRQVCKASAETAKTISGRRFTSAASSAWPHSTGSATRLPAVSAAFSVQAGAPEKPANSTAANGG